MNCPACGAEAPAGARFCPSCGKSLITVAEERRLVTVLFADIVGFTTLAQHLDPEQVKRFIDSTFQTLGFDIQRFGGKIDKIIGDEIVALFGAPVAHSDDPERAVRAALAMQETAARISDEGDIVVRLRIGITTGEVLVGATAAGGDYTAMGDTMNLGSRFEQLAEPGEILVGPATHAATRNSIVYRPLGALATRGRTGEVMAWRAMRAIGTPGARRLARPPLVGRDNELGVVDAIARLAVESQRAQIVLLQGQAGVGKNRIASEAAERQRRKSGALVVEGRCAPYGEANVWWPIAEVLRQIIGLPGDVDDDEAKGRINEWLDTQPSVVLPADQRSRVIRALLHALGYATELRGGDRDRNRSEVVMAVTTLLRARLADEPIVIVLSDADWASEAMWVLVEKAMTELAHTALLVVVTARTADLPPSLRSGEYGSHTIPVLPLDRDSTARLLGSLGMALSERNTAALVERSAGNPFFLQELVAVIDGRLREDPELLPDEVVDRLMTARAEELPDTLRGTIAARLDALEPAERQLIQDAAVLGRAGPVEGLRELASMSSRLTDVDSLLRSVEDADLLELGDGRFRFRSDLVRDVAYATITKTRRAQRHLQIARFLEQRAHPSLRNSVVAAIADHYRRSAELVAELGYVPNVDAAMVTAKAITWVEEAGTRALESSPPSAAEWFSAGLELSSDPRTRANMRFGRAKARLETGDLSGALADLDDDDLEVTDDVLGAKALAVKGNLERLSGDLERAAALLREAADRLASLGELAEQANALRLLGITEAARSQPDLARRALEASRRVAASIGDHRSEAWALQSLAWHAFEGGRVDDAERMAELADDLFTELEDSAGLTWTCGVKAWVLLHKGQLDDSRAMVEEMLPEALRRGDPWAEAMLLVLEASLDLWGGQPNRALNSAGRALKAATRADDVTLAVQARAIEARALVSIRRVAEGLQALEHAFAIAEHQGAQSSRRIAAAAACAATARIGEADRVLRWANRFDASHDRPELVGEREMIVAIALALMQLDRLDEAIHELAWLDEPVTLPSRADVDAVASLLHVAAGDVERATTHIDSVLAGPATYLDRVRARLALAAIHMRASDSAAARAVLEEARREVGRTGDLVSIPLIDLIAGTWGLFELEAAQSRAASIGLGTNGWITVGRLLLGAPVSTVRG